MQFSIIASFTGNPEDQGFETNYSEALSAIKEANLDFTETTPEDSEYRYLAEEDKDSWWWQVQDIQSCGILSKDQLTTFLDSLGAFANDNLTGGSLGGPLSIGIVADIDHTIESQQLIACIRVTPIPERNNEPMSGDERTWDRLRAAYLAVFGL